MDCPPLEYILENIDTLPKKVLGGGGFSNVLFFVVDNISYAVKVIPIVTEKHIETFKQEVLNWKIANLNPKLRDIVPHFCESALVSKEIIESFKTPITKAFHLYTEWRDPDDAIAFGFIFTRETNYIHYSQLPKRYEETTKVIDNLIQMLDILHLENYIHGDIKWDNILIKNNENYDTFFIDLEGLCKLPCTREIPYTHSYIPPDYSARHKLTFKFQKSGTLTKAGRLKTKVTNKTFTRYSKEMDRYAMGLVILQLLDWTTKNDARWRKSGEQADLAVKNAYYQKAYTLIRYPIHIYASEIGQSKLNSSTQTAASTQTAVQMRTNRKNRKNQRTRKVRKNI